MRIAVQFHFNDQDEAAAITGVSGDVSDIILPCVDDLVRHRDKDGVVFVGRVTSRLYSYDIPDGNEVSGVITVIISMNRLSLQ